MFGISTFPRTVRERASVAGTVAARMSDEDPETSVDRTIGLERAVELARAWDTGDSEDFEKWPREVMDDRDVLGDRAAHVEYRGTASAPFSHRSIIR
jgi:hypothetical protein